LAWPSPPGAAPTQIAAKSPPGNRVLVVSDRARIALDLQRSLREAGYRVVGPATCDDETSRLLGRFAIDCAIVDLDGKDVPDTALLDRCGVPFVILTSRMDPPEQHFGRPRLHAPFTTDDVAEAIERAIAQRKQGGVAQYPVAPPSSVWPRIFPQL
jgi:DNA-binding NtrC family response regulator